MVPTASLHAKTPVDAILVYHAGKGFSQSSTVRKAFEDAICYWSTYYVLAVHNRLAVPSPLYDSQIPRNGTDCLSDVSHSMAAEIRFFPSSEFYTRPSSNLMDYAPPRLSPPPTSFLQMSLAKLSQKITGPNDFEQNCVR